MTTRLTKSQKKKIRIGISSCLLGETVRYDGGHRREPEMLARFGDCVKWIPVCPEVEFGMGVPREPIRLQRAGKDIRLISTATGEDITKGMDRFASKRAKTLSQEALSGFIFKKNSPSCGPVHVKVYTQGGRTSQQGIGRFALAMQQEYPFLPVEEEDRLRDPRLRDNFIVRLFAYHHWTAIGGSDSEVVALAEFHGHHYAHLMARSQAGCKRLGLLMARQTKKKSQPAITKQYGEQFFKIMERVPNLRGHEIVLQHLADQVANYIDSADRKALGKILKNYRQGRLPLIAPLTLLQHYARKFELRDMTNQTYLFPQPNESTLLFKP